jgi:hypothetical protein
MQHDPHQARTDTFPSLLAWGTPNEIHKSFFESAGWWLIGGASLLLWTAVALILTST